MVAAGGRRLASDLTGVTPEGESWRRWGQYISSDPSDDPSAHRFLVINPLAWSRHVRWPLPPDIGGAAPYAILEMFLVDNYRERAPLEMQTPPGMVIDTKLPSFGYRVIDYLDLQAAENNHVEDGVLENRWYRLEVDPQVVCAAGSTRSWAVN